MDVSTGMTIVFAATLGFIMLPLYDTALAHRKKAEELEKQYEEVCGQQPVRPYEREGASRFTKFLYNYPLRLIGGETLIDIYKGELRQAIEEAAHH